MAAARYRSGQAMDLVLWLKTYNIISYIYIYIYIYI